MHQVLPTHGLFQHLLRYDTLSKLICTVAFSKLGNMNNCIAGFCFEGVDGKKEFKNLTILALMTNSDCNSFPVCDSVTIHMEE